MRELVKQYIEHIAKLKMVKKPKMPNFDVSAYTDNEYLSAIDAINVDFDKINDVVVTEKFLKGD